MQFNSISRLIIKIFPTVVQDNLLWPVVMRYEGYEISDGQIKRWGLVPDYPMVAPNYARRRSILVRKTGLGKRRSGLPAFGKAIGLMAKFVYTPAGVTKHGRQFG